MYLLLKLAYFLLCNELGHKFSKDGSKQALLNLTQDPEKVIPFMRCTSVSFIVEANVEETSEVQCHDMGL